MSGRDTVRTSSGSLHKLETVETVDAVDCGLWIGRQCWTANCELTRTAAGPNQDVTPPLSLSLYLSDLCLPIPGLELWSYREV